LAREFDLLTQELCEDAGLPAYEISNHARPGSESRHNLIYWRGHDYAGIGAGAHARIAVDGKRRAMSNIKSPEAWRESVEQSGHGRESDESLSKVESADEYLLMGLRLAEGIDLQRLQAISGKSPEAKTIDALSAQGLVHRQGERLAATPSGRLVLERIILELAA